MEVDGLRGLEEVRRRRFARLTADSRQVLHAVALRCCNRDRAAADDLLQDTYERAWRNLEALHHEAKAIAWLVSIMRNCWIDACRKRARHCTIAEIPEQAAGTEERSLWQRVTVDDFHRAIEKLDEPYRSVVIMHDVDRLSNAAIAQRLAIPYATVATRVHRAHKKLRLLLQIALDGTEED